MIPNGPWSSVWMCVCVCYTVLGRGICDSLYIELQT